MSTRERKLSVKTLQVRNAWSFSGALAAQQNASVGGALAVTGAATFSTISASTGVKFPVAALTTTGAIGITAGLVTLAHASTAIEATLVAPVAGNLLYIVNTSASGTAAHTVTLPAGVTWNGTNRVATFDAPGEALLVMAVSATRFSVIVNTGNVAFSDPA